jgi:hypothetical protein
MNRFAPLCLTTVLFSLSAAGAGGAWLQDCSKAPIPASPAAGRIKGQAFKVDRVEITVSPSDDRTTYFVSLRQGKEFFPDREFKLFLLRKKGQALESAPYVVGPEGVFKMPNSIRDKNGVNYPPVQGIHATAKAAPGKTFGDTDMQSEFTMRLEFGKKGPKGWPGRIYLCLRDKERSFVAGTFTAVVTK